MNGAPENVVAALRADERADLLVRFEELRKQFERLMTQFGEEKPRSGAIGLHPERTTVERRPAISPVRWD
jgi:hypothetical protein